MSSQSQGQTELPTSSAEIPAELKGLRMTKQRREVYGVLLDMRDHPTAQDVFLRAKERMPSISLATVYNCLEALVGHELVKQVNFDRAPSRYCPNLEEHVHFQDEETGKIFDVVFKPNASLTDVLQLPDGVQVNELELTLKGHMPTSPDKN